MCIAHGIPKSHCATNKKQDKDKNAINQQRSDLGQSTKASEHTMQHTTNCFIRRFSVDFALSFQQFFAVFFCLVLDSVTCNLIKSAWTNNLQIHQDFSLQQSCRLPTIHTKRVKCVIFHGIWITGWSKSTGNICLLDYNQLNYSSKQCENTIKDLFFSLCQTTKKMSNAYSVCV